MFETYYITGKALILCFDASVIEIFGLKFLSSVKTPRVRRKLYINTLVSSGKI